ncbi:MAG: V-type ATPase subunit [archaeon]|nr:V-type ATPase subunit [archaeon]
MVDADILYLLPIFALSGAMVYFVWYKIQDSIPFLYPTGVIMAKEARLLDDNRLDELALMSLEEFVSSLGGTEYGEYIKGTGYEEIEKGLLLFRKNLYSELFKLIPERFTDIFDFLVREWDVMNLRTVLTGVHAGLPVDKVRNRLIEGGEMFEKIASVAGEDIERIASTFEGTPLAGAIEEYNRIKDFSGIDLALGKWMIEDISLKLDGRGGKKLWMVKRYLDIYVDGLNLKVMLRGKEGGVTEDEIKRFLIGAEVARVYGETGSVREFLERVRETRYGYLIAEVEDDVMRMELRIDEAVLRKVKELSSEEAFGFGPILRFLVMKDAEIRNLRVIAKLKGEGVPNERIKEMMVRVGKGG